MRLHADIGYVTPDDEHHGRGDAIRRARRDGLAAARQARIAHRRISKVRKIEGVADVAVAVTAGRVTVTVTSSQPLSPAVIREAVEKAGYELVSGSA